MQLQSAGNNGVDVVKPKPTLRGRYKVLEISTEVCTPAVASVVSYNIYLQVQTLSINASAGTRGIVAWFLGVCSVETDEEGNP
eukprot:5779529-Amphidinium_carterae.1